MIKLDLLHTLFLRA